MNWKIIKQLASYQKDGRKAGLLEELVDNFFREFPEQEKALKLIIRTGKAEMLEIAAHKLKGGSYTIGAQSLGDVCLILEDKGRNKDLSDSERYLSEIHDIAAAAETKLRSFIDKLRK